MASLSSREVLPQDKVSKLVDALLAKAQRTIEEKDIYENVIDPFSALLEAAMTDRPLADWLETERVRQNQKSLQNAIGTFQENLAALLPTWAHAGAKNLIDLRSAEKRALADMKNKFNTVKGSSRHGIYDELLAAIEREPNPEEWTAYFIEFIPQNSRRYDEPFEPTDHTARGEKRERRDNIRIIDGYSFYAKYSDPPQEDALDTVFEQVMRAVEQLADGQHHREYKTLFDLAFHDG